MKTFFYKFILPPTLLVLIGVLAVGVFNQAKKNYNLHAQISKLETNIESVEKQNEDLQKAIENFQDPSTIDREARRRLNLKKDGEEVVIILPPGGEDKNIIEEQSPETGDKASSFWHKIISWFE
ncbi:MAG: septum formation initiator family protein [Candidatus Spechtbacterales bacterium]